MWELYWGFLSIGARSFGGLFIGTALKLARPLSRKPWGLALAAACFGCLALGRVSLFALLPAAALLGWLAARRNLL